MTYSPLAMRQITYYRWALAAPLFVPLLIIGLALVLPSVFGFAALLIGGTLLYIAIPYPLFALAILWWSRRKSARELRRAAWVTPLLFAPLCGLSMGAFYGQSPTGWSFWASFAEGVVLALIYGYAYVVLVMGVARTARFGPESPEPASNP